MILIVGNGYKTSNETITKRTKQNFNIMKCPKCSTEIIYENINVMTDVGICQSCKHVFKISESLNASTNDGFEIENPPKGAWIRRELDQVVIGATTRSFIAFFLVPFMLVWSGGSLGGIYGTQIMAGEFDPFMSLFGIPFLIGSIIFWSIALMAIAGKVELTLDREGGSVFTGVGKIGLTQRFSWDEITNIREDGSNYRYPGGNGVKIQMEGKKRLSFGTGLNDSRRYYLLRALKSILIKVKSNKNCL